MIKKGVLILLVLLVVNTALAVNIERSVEDDLKTKDKVSVIVVLKEVEAGLKASNVKYSESLEEKKQRIKDLQDKVLSNLDYETSDTIRAKYSTNSGSPKEKDLILKRKFKTLEGFSGELTAKGLEKLKQDPNVESIYPNRKIKAFLAESAPLINATRVWNLKNNNINLTGKHETICVIDTGVDYTHYDMGNCAVTSNINDRSCDKVIGGYDYVNDDNNPIDDEGHGTHVAGIIASTNITQRGIAYDARIAAVKVLDSSGNGNDADLIAGIEWCNTYAETLNITVISMSLGSASLYSSHCDSNDPLVAAAVKNSIQKNISVIAATGNDGSKTSIGSPACIKNVTSVGMTYDADVGHICWGGGSCPGGNTCDDVTTAVDKIVCASNKNSITDLFAPGAMINSLKLNGGLDELGGTSMATPMVAGAFALIHQYIKLAQGRDALPSEIQDYLNDTGTQITDTGETDLTFSRINILKALQSLDTTPANISFIFPTPANNTITYNNTLTINISTNESVNWAILDFNGTNYTMSGSGTNWHYTKTVPSNHNATYTYKAWGNDTLGNVALSEFRVFISNNTPPLFLDYNPASLDYKIVEGNYNFTFNITINDPDTNPLNITWYRNTSIVDTEGNYTFKNNYSAAGFYNITVIVFDTNHTISMCWNFTVNNTNQQPSALASINSTDFLNRTNGTLIGSWSYSDDDNDDYIQDNETRWYNNTEEVINLRNLTSVSSSNTTKNENWTFSVRVYDGTNWSLWVNSTNLTILNTAPFINITNLSYEVRETDIVNITLNATDIDYDTLTFNINKTEFSQAQNQLLWITNLTDSGSYSFNITVNDSESMDSVIIDVTVLEARDADSDGNPDFNDTDDDNDGISDTDDFLLGNITSINSSISFNITINSSANYSKIFNGTYIINITNNTHPMIEFNWTFNSSSKLDLYNITIKRNTNGSGKISIRGVNLKSLNKRKTAYIEKLNSSVQGVCIKDYESDYEDISSSCDSSYEYLINCNNVTTNGYTCYDLGTRYKITGLNHSAVTEACRDNDGDGYGTYCTLGSDCNDNDATKTTSCTTTTSSGGGGGGGGGGSGGGGGGGAAYNTGLISSHYFQEILADSSTTLNVKKEAIPVRSITFDSNNDLKSVTIKVELLENYTGLKDSYAFLEITKEKIENKDIRKAVIEFSVNNSYFKYYDVDKTKLYRLEGSDWVDYPTERILENNSKTYFSSTVPGFSVFAIASEKKFAEEKVEETIKEDIKEEKIISKSFEEVVEKEEKPYFNYGILVIILIVIVGIGVYLFFNKKKKRHYHTSNRNRDTKKHKKRRNK